jgi:predicted RNA-binding protein with PUA-like domain
MIPARETAMWLLKTEPSTYSYDDLEKEGRAVWDGVKNPFALRNMREMKAGDRVVIYHTGDEKAAVGLAEVVREAYPDPKSKDARLLVVDLKAKGRIAAPVNLATIKTLDIFADSPLVRQGRLSVVRLTAPQWKLLTGGSK